MATRKPVFLDANGWIAILNADDADHVAATDILQRLVFTLIPLVTTELVLAEVGNGLARTRLRAKFVEVVTSFAASEHGRIVRIDDEIFRSALEMYARVTDKAWGLVDCTSFVVMRNQGIQEAFTADRHFEQSGFTCLLSTV